MKSDTEVLFSRKRIGNVDPTINISKAVIICNAFHFLFAASKACFIPFLTVFLRLLGMSATETGVVIAIKTVTGFVWAPMWARCAISCNKRRFVLMFSVFMFAASYMSLAVVYQNTTHYAVCNNTINSENRLIIPSYFEPYLDGLKDESGTTPVPAATTTTTSTTTSKIKTTTSPPKPNTTTTITNAPVTLLTTTTTTALPKPVPPSQTPTTTTTTTTTTATTTTTTATTTTTTTTTTATTTTASTTVTNGSNEARLHQIVSNLLSEMNITSEELNSLHITGPELYDLVHEADPTLPTSVEEISKIWELLKNSNGIHNSRTKRSIMGYSSNLTWNGVVYKGRQLWEDMAEEKLQLFLLVLLVIIVGEFLSCSIEKVADDAWFDFLDRIDDLEKYGKQRLGGNFAFVIFPLLITLAVNFTDCMLPLSINHFLLHFYAFGFFLGLTFVVAFFYPVPPPQNEQYSTRIMKGMRIACCDCQGFLYVFTLFIMGMVYASYHNFLFWLIQDLGGSELNMGMCVSIGAVAEIPMLMLSQKMVKKMGNAGVVALALFCLIVRVLYYSFVPSPWAVMPAEVLHAFTHTAMWFAVLSYDDFNVGAMVDRSIRSVLSSIYFGVGFSAGCLLSGLAYDLFGTAVMFQGASVIVGVWFVLFSVISKCVPKKERIRYVKLLHADDSDGSDSIEDDWLEMALKEN